MHLVFVAHRRIIGHSTSALRASCMISARRPFSLTSPRCFWQTSHRLRPASNTPERAERGGSKTLKTKPTASVPDPGLSLVEQLFPEETKKYNEAQRLLERSHEVPRLSLDSPPFPFVELPSRQDVRDSSGPYQEAARRMKEEGVRTSVLVLSNASLNLTEADFRRLIPQGQHLPGWTLEQGDIVKVIPARDMVTLEQKNSYYLLFSSQLSAFVYQGHASRIARLAGIHTQKSLDSPVPLPKNFQVEGLDAAAAIDAFTLVPAGQIIQLRRLNQPLSPMMESIVRHQGYPALVDRPNKMPFELRLTFEGLEPHLSLIRFVLLATAKERAMGWSGGEEALPKITRWQPQAQVSELDWSPRSAAQASRAATGVAKQELPSGPSSAAEGENSGVMMRNEAANRSKAQLRMRTNRAVYILGFHTERAAQSFQHYWHRRPFISSSDDTAKASDEDSLPPMANVEILR